jgi:hypothetical protein
VGGTGRRYTDERRREHEHDDDHHHDLEGSSTGSRNSI